MFTIDILLLSVILILTVMTFWRIIMITLIIIVSLVLALGKHTENVLRDKMKIVEKKLHDLGEE